MGNSKAIGYSHVMRTRPEDVRPSPGFYVVHFTLPHTDLTAPLPS
jgi:hypothetical protein